MTFKVINPSGHKLKLCMNSPNPLSSLLMTSDRRSVISKRRFSPVQLSRFVARLLWLSLKTRRALWLVMIRLMIVIALYYALLHKTYNGRIRKLDNYTPLIYNYKVFTHEIYFGCTVQLMRPQQSEFSKCLVIINFRHYIVFCLYTCCCVVV